MKLTRKQFLMLAVMVFGTFVAILNQTVVTPALPSIMVETGVDASMAQWLTTGFTLVNAIMVPVTAYLTDRYKTRTLFAISMAVFAVGSALAGWAANFPILLVGRLLQAAGAGVSMPLVMTTLMLTFPPERRGSAMGIFGIVIAFAPAAGPSVAGVVIDSYGYHVLFYAIAILSVLVVIASVVFIDKAMGGFKPDSTLDKPSVILSTLGFGGLLYGLSTIGSTGVNVADIAITLVGVIILVLFFRRQLRMEEPMLQVRVLANRKFLIGTIIGMLVQGSLLAAGILMPIYLQSYMGYSATVSGLVILPGAVIMGAMGPIAGRLFDKHGPRVLSLIGMTLLTISTLAFAFLGDATGVIYLTVLYAVRMFSMSLVNMPINTWAMNALDNSLINHGTSVGNTFRQVAGSLGTAILVSVSTMATGMASQTGMDATHAGILGVNAAFFVGTMLCLIGLIITIVCVTDKPGEAAAVDPDSRNRSTLERIMQRDVYTLPDTATVCDAVELFVSKHISAAPIVNAEGHAVGFISDGDVARVLAKRKTTFTDPVLFTQLTTDADNDEFDDKAQRVMESNVCSIGARGVITVDVHTDLREVCRILGENHLKKIPVTDEGHLVGVVNRSDIAHYTMAKYLEARNQSEEAKAVEA